MDLSVACFFRFGTAVNTPQYNENEHFFAPAHALRQSGQPLAVQERSRRFCNAVMGPNSGRLEVTLDFH